MERRLYSTIGQATARKLPVLLSKKLEDEVLSGRPVIARRASVTEILSKILLRFAALWCYKPVQSKDEWSPRAAGRFRRWIKQFANITRDFPVAAEPVAFRGPGPNRKVS